MNNVIRSMLHGSWILQSCEMNLSSRSWYSLCSSITHFTIHVKHTFQAEYMAYAIVNMICTPCSCLKNRSSKTTNYTWANKKINRKSGIETQHSSTRWTDHFETSLQKGAFYSPGNPISKIFLLQHPPIYVLYSMPLPLVWSPGSSLFHGIPWMCPTQKHCHA